MRFVLAVVYTGLIFVANAVAAQDAPFAGDMRKLVLPAAPVALPDVALVDGDDAPASLADYRGKWVVLNFWATWCAPCREEMPALDRLQAAMPDIAVLPVATGRNAVEGIRQFYAQAAIKNLPILRDPSSELSRGVGVLALPVTLIVNDRGEEVARLIGDAAWDSPDAIAAITAIRAGQ